MLTHRKETQFHISLSRREEELTFRYMKMNNSWIYSAVIFNVLIFSKSVSHSLLLSSHYFDEGYIAFWSNQNY